jgi:serine/threonine protein kinase/Tol biopolymer transport system component
LPLQSGTRVGGYEIAAPLGAGGMGEVYRARDTRLGRDVAIKILSPRIAADRDAVLRFEREARALATLNHPNIAAIYDVIETAGQPALVLELVDGQTLADRIAATRPLSLDEALDYAKQIAEALDVAHEAGIVHRDLKPGNIKITDDGRIKVLDFGLAKAIAAASGESSGADLANSPTITVHGTGQGVILGTAAYMSPEQARGKRIDKRTDIWAFGCVLYEMLTSRAAFAGETTSDVLAAIIERAPDLSLLPPATPPHVRRIIERCLEKDPKRRARDIADVRVDFDRVSVTETRPRRSLLVPALATIAAIAGIASVVLWRSRPEPGAAPPTIELAITPPPGHTLEPVQASPSPDGRYVAFVARDEKRVDAIFVRSLDAAASRRIDGTDGATTPPVWSPDGRSIAFLAGGVWKRVAINGGPPISIVANVQANLGASWGAGDVFLLSPANRTSLFKVPIGGGKLQPVTTLNTDSENSHRWPMVLPDGRHYLFTVRSDTPDRLGIKLGALDSTEVRSLVNVASQGLYAQPGWLLFETPDQVLMAQPLDPATWTLGGPARPIVGPVRYTGSSFRGSFDVSLDGSVLTYLAAPRSASTLEWFDRTGKPLGRIGPERDYRSVRLSRDGRLITLELPDPQVGTRDVWLMDAATQSLSRLTTNPATDWRGVISPDGKTVAYASDRAGPSSIFRTSLAAPGHDELVLRVPEAGVFPTDWSADGSHVFAMVDDVSGAPRRFLMVPANGGSAVPLVDAGQQRLIMPRVSPDGSRLAYSSSDGGPLELYVASFRDRTRVLVWSGGGSNPVWGRDGNELFFVNAGAELMRATFSGGNLSGRPQMLFRPCDAVGRTFTRSVTEWNYDVSADGTRFLVICDPSDSLPSAINVVVNWQSKLK